MTTLDYIYVTLATIGVSSFVFLVYRVASLLKTVQLFIDTELKTTLTHTNKTLQEVENTLNQTTTLLNDSKDLIANAKALTQKANFIKSNFLNYSTYVNLALDLFKKIVELKKEKSKNS